VKNYKAGMPTEVHMELKATDTDKDPMQTAKYDDDQFFHRQGAGLVDHTVLYGTMLRQDIAA
jgi:hypothetical protein